MKVDSVSAPSGAEATREKGPSLEVVDSTADANPEFVDMDAYRRDVPLWKRIWQHSLTQMMLLSVQAFCGPAMDDAIAGRPSRKYVDCLRCILTFLRPRRWWSGDAADVQHGVCSLPRSCKNRNVC